jgi:hypothetical protein
LAFTAGQQASVEVLASGAVLVSFGVSEQIKFHA